MVWSFTGENAFSEKIGSQILMACNPCCTLQFRIPKTVRVTLAVTSGQSDHDWSLEEIALSAI
jgi:hypothetical protein